MDELEQFLKDYTKRTFSQTLKREKVDPAKIKRLDDFAHVKANSINEKERTIEFVASKEVKDRQGDIVRVNGISVEKFMKNPVGLWAHKYDQLPIAKCVALSVEGDEFIVKYQFATKELSEFADQVFRMYLGGFLHAVSIGFIPLKSSFDETEAAFIIEKSELLETSFVPVPAHGDALMRGFKAITGTEDKAKGTKKSEEGDDTENEREESDAGKPEDPIADPEEIQKELESLKETMEHHKTVLKQYRKHMVLLRDALKIEATEDEEDTIKEVMQSAVAICRLAHKTINASAENPHDADPANPQAANQPRKKQSLPSRLDKIARKL